MRLPAPRRQARQILRRMRQLAGVLAGTNAHDPAEKGRKGRRRLITKLEGNGGHGDGTHQHRDGDQHLGLLLPLLEAQSPFLP